MDGSSDEEGDVCGEDEATDGDWRDVWSNRTRGLGERLMEACECGDWDTAVWLLGQGVDPNWGDPQGDTAAHLCVRRSRFETLRALLRTPGIDLGRRNARGDTALHEACEAGLLEFAEALVLAGAPLEAENTAGETPLVVTCRLGREDMLDFCAQHGAAVTSTALLAACKAGQEALARRLADLRPPVVSMEDAVTKMTPLDSACLSGDPKVVELVALLGGYPTSWKTLSTEFFSAALWGYLMSASSEMDSSAIGRLASDVLVSDCFGLYEAELLLSSGIFPRSAPSSAAAIAYQRGLREVTLLLLEFGADCSGGVHSFSVLPSAPDTLLHLACEKGDLLVLKKAIESGLPLNVTPVTPLNVAPVTPLNVAARVGCIEAIELLFAAGADGGGLFRLSSGCLEVMQRLLYHGVNPTSFAFDLQVLTRDVLTEDVWLNMAEMLLSSGLTSPLRCDCMIAAVASSLRCAELLFLCLPATDPTPFLITAISPVRLFLLQRGADPTRDLLLPRVYRARSPSSSEDDGLYRDIPPQRCYLVHAAVDKDDVPRLQDYLDWAYDILDQKAPNGKTPLRWACDVHAIRCVRLLLSRGCRPLERVNPFTLSDQLLKLLAENGAVPCYLSRDMPRVMQSHGILTDTDTL